MKTKLLVLLGAAMLAGCTAKVMSPSQLSIVQKVCADAGLASKAEQGVNGVTAVKCFPPQAFTE